LPPSRSSIAASLLIASVALARRHSFPGMLSPIRRQRLSHIYNFIKATLLISPDKTLVATRIDQFPLAASFVCHPNPSLT